jgi:hypothetical protein
MTKIDKYEKRTKRDGAGKCLSNWGFVALFGGMFFDF